MVHCCLKASPKKVGVYVFPEGSFCKIQCDKDEGDGDRHYLKYRDFEEEDEAEYDQE